MVAPRADGPVVDARGALAAYAERFHAAVGTGHHIASPLGAWLVLALAGRAAAGDARADLSEVLGADVDTAAALAADLLGHPHPVVPTAAAVWSAPGVVADEFAAWVRALPAGVAVGDVPSQEDADAWARVHSLGLIERFPGDVHPDDLLLLASALATKVSWLRPYTVVPAAALRSPWAATVNGALRSPTSAFEFVAPTDRAGDVAVHTAHAVGGLAVTSVIAAPDVPAGDVLAVAHDLAFAGPAAPRRSLYDLPLGDGPAWTVAERETSGEQRELCTAVLPAWSAYCEHDLLAGPGLGFAALGTVLAGLLRSPAVAISARQVAVARYDAAGFEAAAVTGIAMGRLPPSTTGSMRVADLRFGHPYAVVAVATAEGGGPWHGLPVFSGWVARPDDPS